MRRAFKMFWKGLTALLAGIANWITVVLGMSDDSRYGKVLRRIVGTCFALLVVIITTALCLTIGDDVYRGIKSNVCRDTSYDVYDVLSRGVTHCIPYGKAGYIVDENGRKTVEDIAWLSKPLGDDSLVCYSDGKKRGYFNLYTGQPAIKPTYAHAWVFSEGLAAVEEDGVVKFIDPAGKVVFDTGIRRKPDFDGYVFHDGFLVMHDEAHRRVGLLNRRGEWALRPAYQSIEKYDSLWVLRDGKQAAVVDLGLRQVLPMMEAELWVGDGGIHATMPDHTMRLYTCKGELKDDFLINAVCRMTYDTEELRYANTESYDEEGNLTSVTQGTEPYHAQATARCLKYEAAPGYWGLMTSDGRIVTPPSYREISAIGHDLYLCEADYLQGVVLNGRGEIIL